MSQAQPAQLISLSKDQYKRLEKAVCSPIRVEHTGNDPAQLGFQLGVQHVLKHLREGFVIGE